MPSRIGSIETFMKLASGSPAAAAQARASSMCTCSVWREGSVMAYTFSGPSARAAIASDSAESMPPERPSAARLRPAPSTTSRSRRTLASRIGASCSRPRSRCTRSSVPPAARDLAQRPLAVTRLHVDRGDRIAQHGGLEAGRDRVQRGGADAVVGGEAGHQHAA